MQRQDEDRGRRRRVERRPSPARTRAADPCSWTRAGAGRDWRRPPGRPWSPLPRGRLQGVQERERVSGALVWREGRGGRRTKRGHLCACEKEASARADGTATGRGPSPTTDHDVGLLRLDLGQQRHELLRQARLVENFDELAEHLERADLGREDARFGEEDLHRGRGAALVSLSLETSGGEQDGTRTATLTNRISWTELTSRMSSRPGITRKAFSCTSACSDSSEL